MRLILDYEPITGDYIVKVDSKSKYKDSIVGVGKSIEESVDNMIDAMEIFLKCYKMRDGLYKTFDRWYNDLRLVVKVRIKFTKRFAENINPLIRFKVKGELISKLH